MNRILTYDNQLEFKKFAKLGAKRKFYFDNTSCVDDKTSENIPNVYCDGTLTFGKAKKILIKYFNDKAKSEAKEKKRLAKEKAKAKKVAKKAKAEAKKLKAKEKAKAKREAAKIKAQAKKEKVAIKKAKLKEKKRLAKEKAKALETAKKVKINKKSSRRIVAELDTVEADVKTAAKLIKNTMTTIAAELVKLNIEDREKRIKMLEKLGYQIREDNNELIVSFIDTKSKKLKIHKSDNIKKVAINETDHPNKNENVDVNTSTQVEFIKPIEDNKVIDDTIESEVNDISNVGDELDLAEIRDEIMSPQIEVDDEDEIEDDDLVDEYNEDDDRYDREMDDDKVDYRRDYFNDFGDDGEVNDDY